MSDSVHENDYLDEEFDSSSDLFDVPDNDDEEIKPAGTKKKKRKKKSGVIALIIVICLILAAVIGTLYFVLKNRDNQVKEILAAEQAKQSEYIALVDSAALPAGWEQSTLDTLKEQAKNAYDTTFLEAAQKAVDGDDEAAVDVLEQKESVQPQSVSQYTEILGNLSSYPENLVKLAASNSDAMNLVINYQNHSGSISAETPLTENVTESIPNLKNFDERWAYIDYNNGLMATNGSIPVSLSMVFSHLFDDPTFTPVVMADFAKEFGYETAPVSEYDSVFSGAAYYYGINMTPLVNNPTYITNSLNSGGTVIAELGSENNSRYVVISGLNDDGTWIVMDPAKSEASENMNPEDARDQIIAAYSFW